MANRIQLRRGTKANMPTLKVAELGFATDMRELYIGTLNGNLSIGGSQWYTGTAMSGTITTTGYYSYSACPAVKVGDIYLNTSYGYVYECTTAGSGTSAKWTYKGNIRGKGISSTAVTYQSGTSGTSAPTGTWSTSVPSVSQGNYLWTRVVITYTDGTTSTSYSVARQGANGTNGKDAADYVVSTVAELKTAIANLPIGGTILLKSGTYDLGNYTTSSTGITFKGLSLGTTIIKHNGPWASSASKIDLFFEHLTIRLGNTSGSGADRASLRFTNCQVCNDTDYIVTEKGNLYEGYYDLKFSNCTISLTCNAAVSSCFQGISTNGAVTLTDTNVTLNTTLSYNVPLIYAASRVNIDCCQFNGNTSTCYIIGTSVESGSIRNSLLRYQIRVSQYTSYVLDVFCNNVIHSAEFGKSGDNAYLPFRTIAGNSFDGTSSSSNFYVCLGADAIFSNNYILFGGTKLLNLGYHSAIVTGNKGISSSSVINKSSTAIIDNNL